MMAGYQLVEVESVNPSAILRKWNPYMARVIDRGNDRGRLVNVHTMSFQKCCLPCSLIPSMNNDLINAAMSSLCALDTFRRAG